MGTGDGMDGAVERAFDEKMKWPLAQDHEILAGKGRVRGWISVPLEGGGRDEGKGGEKMETEDPNQAVMEGEVMKS